MDELLDIDGDIDFTVDDALLTALEERTFALLFGASA